MALTPENELLTIGQAVATREEKDLPSRTWRINWQAGRVEGIADGLEAVQQAVHKILMTERFAHLIYSWDYGSEVNGLLGESRPVVEAELPRIITEALKADGRVLEVTGFAMERRGRDSLAVRFVVETEYGAMPYEKEVKLSV